MALTLQEYAAVDNVDIGRVMKMALVHDLVEIYAGDTFAYDTAGYQDKLAREQASADRVFGLLPPDLGAEYRSLWEEFDRMESPDALYASAIDRFQPFFINARTDGYTWVRHDGIKVSQVYQRMEPVKTVIPALWEYVEQVIRDAVEKGYLHPDQ